MCTSLSFCRESRAQTKFLHSKPGKTETCLSNAGIPHSCFAQFQETLKQGMLQNPIPSGGGAGDCQKPFS